MFFEKLNASTVSIAFDEVYTALQQGTVDGQENTLSSVASANFDEVQDYLTINHFSRVDYALLTNTDFWEGLDEKTEKIVQEGIDGGQEAAREKVDELNQEGLEKMKERGEIEIYELTEEEKDVFRAEFEDIYEKYKAKFGEDAVDDAMSR